MAIRVLDVLDDPAQWEPLAPGGGASTEVAMAASEAPPHAPGLSACLLSATAAATDHRVERALPAPEDLEEMDELRLWVRGSRAATGGAAAPFSLEVRLASAAMGFDDADNAWHRFLPVARPGTWEMVRLSLRDLHPDVRAAMNAMRITCVHTGPGFECALGGILAVREELLGDVEAALVERLDGALTLDGSPLEAEVWHSADGTLPGPPDPPAVRVRHRALRPGGGATTFPPSRRDFSGAGFVVYEAPRAWELDYELEVFAESRAGATRIVEHLLAEFSPRGTLRVAGVALPVAWIADPAEAEEPRLRIRVTARQEGAAGQPGVLPFGQVTVGADALS